MEKTWTLFRIIIKLTGDQDRRKITEFEFRPHLSIWFEVNCHWAYLFWASCPKMLEKKACWKKPFWACWLSGEWLLPFGRLVFRRYGILHILNACKMLGLYLLISFSSSSTACFNNVSQHQINYYFGGSSVWAKRWILRVHNMAVS